MLTFQYIPSARIAQLSAEEKIKLILALIKEHKVLIIEGRLQPAEEVALIARTMDNLYEEFTAFKGIEIGILQNTVPAPEISGFKRFKKRLASMLVKEEPRPEGITIIGPAKIIKEIKEEPEKLEMHFQKMFLQSHLKIPRNTAKKKRKSVSGKKGNQRKR